MLDDASPPPGTLCLVLLAALLCGLILTQAGCPGAGGQCLNTCATANDAECDDGGPGSLYDLCALGTDCNDCGSREPGGTGGMGGGAGGGGTIFEMEARRYEVGDDPFTYNWEMCITSCDRERSAALTAIETVTEECSPLAGNWAACSLDEARDTGVACAWDSNVYWNGRETSVGTDYECD